MRLYDLVCVSGNKLQLIEIAYVIIIHYLALSVSIACFLHFPTETPLQSQAFRTGSKESVGESMVALASSTSFEMAYRSYRRVTSLQRWNVLESQWIPVGLKGMIDFIYDF